MIREFNSFGKNKNGGFTSTLFGSDTYKTYWTIKGDNPENPVFECGSYHRMNNNGLEDNPSMVYTHHSVWFRGEPASKEEVRKRLIRKN